MEPLMFSIILIVIAIILFAISFFLKSPAQQTKAEVEELVLSLRQDVFQLEKRVATLEDGTSTKQPESVVPKKVQTVEIVADSAEISQKKADQIMHHYKNGVDIPKIAYKMNLPLKVVEAVIEGQK